MSGRRLTVEQRMARLKKALLREIAAREAEAAAKAEADRKRSAA